MPPLTQRGTAVDRRVMLRLLAGASAAAMTRCSPPDEAIIPYVDMPEGLVAGEPMRFATTLPLSGYGRGFIGISVDGRPVKIEGNPRHPFSLGATDIFAEAEVLSLYDPDRSPVVRRNRQIATWDDFEAEWRDAAAALHDGSGLALVTGRLLSPAALARLDALKSRFPALRRYRYEPINDDAARAGAELAFGQRVAALPRWAEADVILVLDADPLGPGPDQLRLARAHAARRGQQSRQQIHVAEPAWTLTGAAADFRLALAPETIRELARAVAAALGGDLGAPRLSGEAGEFAARVGARLAAAPGRALVLVGEAQPAEVHAVCHWINGRLHAPVDYLAPTDPVAAPHAEEFASIAADLQAGRISALVVLDANPVYDAPSSLNLSEAIASLRFSAHLGLYRDETAACCRWHLPLSHILESWGDGCALDGTASLAQPLIRRLYDTRTRDEVLALLAGERERRAYQLTREVWRRQADGDFEAWWRAALNEGVVAGSAAKPVTVSASRLPELPPAAATSGVTLVLSPDPTLWDGRFANNAWLQECPKPFTKEVWGNAVQIAPEDAGRLGLADEDAVEIALGGAVIAAAATVMPGQAAGVIAASWGQGRTGETPQIGSGWGARFAGLSARPFARLLSGVQLRKSAAALPFRSTQAHTRLGGAAAELFRLGTPADLARPASAPPPPPSLLAIPSHGDYAWAMVIDTDSCIGCNACVVACQAENNVPIVGPEEIAEGRDMHWLRVDAYALSHGEATRRGFQPVPCMHCELAPCEPVCPVEASVHDHEGLNVQVYNRCIGTRFCEANCPYKVRRFNWFAYADGQAYGGMAAALKAQHNPDVSARGRGVMEKCNYCLQRISRARRSAEKQDREIAEGEMVTACQAACPTRAIHFGDLNRADSDVSRRRRMPHHYTLLAELNTRPRTTYLERIYNDDGDST